MNELVDVMRRRRVRREARAKAPRVLPPIVHPSDVGYQTELLDVAHKTQLLISSFLNPALDELLRADADETPAEIIRRLFEKIRFLIPERTPHAPPIAARMVSEINQANRKALNKQFREVVPIDVFADNIGGVAPQLRAAVRRNVDLIESIPTQLLEDVKDTVLPALEQGARVEQIQKQVRERFNVSDSRARLIARDQVGKLNGELSQTRQESVGVTSYEWWCVLDERVRGTHRDLHGKSFEWNDPPVVSLDGRREHPGGDYQCRCQARANVSALLDSLGL